MRTLEYFVAEMVLFGTSSSMVDVRGGNYDERKL